MPTSSDDRRKEFILAANTVFEQKGARRATISDITDSMGVTRSLFYHYFRDKEDIVNATIDAHVDAFVNGYNEWLRSEESQDMRDRILHAVRFVRSYLVNSIPFGGSIEKPDDGALFQRFAIRSASRLADSYGSPQDGYMVSYTDSRLSHPRESFYVLLMGIVSLIYAKPEIEDEVLVDMIADTLHIAIS